MRGANNDQRVDKQQSRESNSTDGAPFTVSRNNSIAHTYAHPFIHSHVSFVLFFYTLVFDFVMRSGRG
jgi:hypothetical protein